MDINFKDKKSTSKTEMLFFIYRLNKLSNIYRVQSILVENKKNPLKISGLYLEAEEEGFEPPEV